MVVEEATEDAYYSESDSAHIALKARLLPSNNNSDDSLDEAAHFDISSSSRSARQSLLPCVRILGYCSCLMRMDSDLTFPSF